MPSNPRLNDRLHARLLAATLAALFVFIGLTVARAEEPTPSLNLTGIGEISVAPDMATIALTVLREAKTARAALDANNAAMAEVLAEMKAFGIEDRDLQTGQFSINPVIVYPRENDANRQPRITGYQVSNSLTVRVRDLGRLGEILDRGVALGVNEGGNIAFGNADTKAVMKSARVSAMEDAIEKAQTLTEAAGVRVGRILSISENSFAPQPMPIAKGRMMMADAAMEAAVPIAGGENTYTVTVNVVFAIDQE